jgi:hypothetical protein
MKRIFKSEEASDFIQKRKNRNIFEVASKEDENMILRNNLNGTKISDYSGIGDL